MRIAKAKDEILSQLLIQKGRVDCEGLANFLKIPFASVYSYAKEMEKQEYVKTIPTSTVGHPNSLRITITPQGEHFYRNGGYSKKINWKLILAWATAIGGIGGTVVSLLCK